MARDIAHFNGPVIAPNATYPFGDIDDTAGAHTIVDRASNSDLQQFFQKLLFEAAITPNNLPDNADNGFQLYQGIQVFVNNYASVIGRFIIGDTYDPAKVYVFEGAETRADDGIVFYSNEFYYVVGNSGPACGGGTVDVLVKSPTLISSNLKVLSVVCGSSGSGVSDFADLIRPPYGIEGWTNATLNATWTNTISTVKYRKDNHGRVFIMGEPKTTSITPNQVIFTLPVGYRPTQFVMFANRQLEGLTPSTVNIGVSTTGEVIYVDGNVPTTLNSTVNLAPLSFFID